MPIPENIKEEILRILTASSIPEEDRALWRERLGGIADTYSFIFVDLFKEDASGLPKATERMKQKVAALDDPGKMQAIAEEEMSDLRSALQDAIL